MSLHFFRIPVADGDYAQTELNRFLASHRVSQTEKVFVEDCASSFWAVCVTVVEGAGDQPGSTETARRTRAIDYREVLPADEFILYDRLRTLRKNSADADGIPAYGICSNEHLADMVRQRVTSAAALAVVAGFTESKMQRYGGAFLAVLVEGVPRLAALMAKAPADPA